MSDQKYLECVTGSLVFFIFICALKKHRKHLFFLSNDEFHIYIRDLQIQSPEITAFRAISSPPTSSISFDN